MMTSWPCARRFFQLAVMILGCDAGPAYYPSAPREGFVRPDWKPIDGDKAFMANIGREAMATIGYDAIIKRAEKAGWIESIRLEKAQSPAGKALIARGPAGPDTAELAKKFTEYALKAGVASQLDSPVPGPGDAVAVGILVFGLIHVGYMAMDEILADPTDTAPAPAVQPTTTTAPPIPISTTRYANQTCTDAELDRLQNEKGNICNLKGGYAADCNQNKKKLKKIPCSAIKLSLQQRQACLAARWAIQTKCFGGKPDASHKGEIGNVQNGIDHCEALELINCAKGHPQAGL